VYILLPWDLNGRDITFCQEPADFVGDGLLIPQYGCTGRFYLPPFWLPFCVQSASDVFPAGTIPEKYVLEVSQFASHFPGPTAFQHPVPMQLIPPAPVLGGAVPWRGGRDPYAPVSCIRRV
jgi:hypothetical protein